MNQKLHRMKDLEKDSNKTNILYAEITESIICHSLKWSIWGWNWNILGKLGQYHGCWCPGSLCHHVTRNHGIIKDKLVLLFHEAGFQLFASFHFGFAFRMGVNPGSWWACHTTQILNSQSQFWPSPSHDFRFSEAHSRIWLIQRCWLVWASTQHPHRTRMLRQSVLFIRAILPPPLYSSLAGLFQVTLWCGSQQ